MISIVVTTFRTDSLYTQACLESIRRWKGPQHELIVVVHDESALLRAYLDASAADGLIDRLVYAEHNHGHTRGFNLGVQQCRGDVIFNICNDILIGPSLVDDCAWQLRNDAQLGVIGWHWYNEGTFWRNGLITDFTLRDPHSPPLAPEHEANIRNAAWYTGRFFEGIGSPKWLHLCNTSFFGIRRELLERIGGGFGREYAHYWADDFLCYAVLDQGYDIRHFDRRFRSRPFFHEYQYEHMDVEDRRRHADELSYEGAFLDSIRLYNGGMTREASVFLHLLARTIPDGATVTNLGVFEGSSAIALMDAAKSKRITFEFVDCFDLPGVSAMSGQPPARQEDFVRNIHPYVGPEHTIHVIRANTLELDRISPSDFVFVNAGHTPECIAHDTRLVQAGLKPGGVAVFHDYGCPVWPAVQSVLDEAFSMLDVYRTMAVYRTAEPIREGYQWADRLEQASV